VSKILVIMRGLPGSGKSFTAKQVGKGGVVYGSDDFFMVHDPKEGKKTYQFNEKLLGHAHLWNAGRVKAAMSKGISPIVVDNTNVKFEYAKPYVDAAREHGYEVRIQEPESPWWEEHFGQDMSPEDEEALVQRLLEKGQHDVPEDKLRKMMSEWEFDFPEKVMNAMGKTASMIIDARLMRVAEEGDEAPGQKLPESDEEKQKQQVQRAEPDAKVKNVGPGAPIPKSEIYKHQTEALQPMVGPLKTDPEVQSMMRNPKSYDMFREMAEKGLLNKAVQVQRMLNDPAKFQEYFPPLKEQEPAIRQYQETQSAPRSPSDSRPESGRPGPGDTKRQGPNIRSPIPTAKASRTAQKVVGDEPRVFADIPGVEGHVNLNVGVQKVFDAMRSIFPPETFQVNGENMSVKVGPLPGKFGEARYDPDDPMQQSIIYIDLDNIIGAVHQAVENEAAKALETGVKAQVNDEIAKRINMKIAELIWETLGHEAGHLRDYQDILRRMRETGQGSLSEAMESVGEKAGKSALGRFRGEDW